MRLRLMWRSGTERRWSVGEGLRQLGEVAMGR